MSSNQHRSVTEFQAGRMSGAPRRWTYWIAFFTAVNGLLFLLQQDLTFLAGLVAPFALNGPAPHFVAALVLASIAYLSSRIRPILFVGLVLYIVDSIFAAYLKLWSGVIMHLIVLVLVGISIAASRRLKAKLAMDANASDA